MRRRSCPDKIIHLCSRCKKKHSTIAGLQTLPPSCRYIESAVHKNEETMAKAKKAASGAPKKKTTAPATTAAPVIDTAQLAVAAAKIVGAKAAFNPPAEPARESAGFKQLRDSLNHPTAAGSMANVLNQTAGPANKKSNAAHFGGKQVGRNQTFGADVNRAGVPRRTGG
jgi:hypothetical protein